MHIHTDEYPDGNAKYNYYVYSGISPFSFTVTKELGTDTNIGKGLLFKLIGILKNTVDKGLEIKIKFLIFISRQQTSINKIGVCYGHL